MVVLIIRFDAGEDTDWDALEARLLERSRLYEGVPGLCSRAFVVNREERQYGGIFYWETTDDLYHFMRSELFLDAVEIYGAEPNLQIFEVVA